MENNKQYEKVYFEMYSKDGYKGRWTYSQRNKRFSEQDISELFKKRPYQDQETKTPEYLYKVASDGIHIAVFYDGLPKDAGK